VDDLLAAMSHEMRTPLSAISGVMELLADTDLDERQGRFVAVARNASDRLLRLLNDVLEVARSDEPSADVTIGTVVVDAVVRESVSIVEPIATMRPVTLRLVNEPEAELVVVADRDRLGQVLLNLLSNAIKFSPPASTVTVSIREVGSRVRIEVQDQGAGIEPSQANRVFVPFDRLDAEARGVAGTGLGLSLSRSIVQEMGGTLEVVDAADPGAMFRVELPVMCMR
jgi:signal transduction histidine kinase